MVATTYVHRCNCFPHIESYWCDIPERKNISCLRHGTSVKQPCITCMRYSEDFSNKFVRSSRSDTDSGAVCVLVYRKMREVATLTGHTHTSPRKTVLTEARNFLAGLPRPPWAFFLDKISSSPTVIRPYIYTYIDIFIRASLKLAAWIIPTYESLVRWQTCLHSHYFHILVVGRRGGNVSTPFESPFCAYITLY